MLPYYCLYILDYQSEGIKNPLFEEVDEYFESGFYFFNIYPYTKYIDDTKAIDYLDCEQMGIKYFNCDIKFNTLLYTNVSLFMTEKMLLSTSIEVLVSRLKRCILSFEVCNLNKKNILLYLLFNELFE